MSKPGRDGTLSGTTRIVAIGRIGQGPEAALFARYAVRLRPKPVVVEIGEARGAAGEARRRDAAALLAAIPAGACAVALDLGGTAPSSEALGRFLASDRGLCFVIGGAEGLDASVLARADRVLSLGPMTWPHLLARAMLVEQLYRAQALADGHPYHRPGRP